MEGPVGLVWTLAFTGNDIGSRCLEVTELSALASAFQVL